MRPVVLLLALMALSPAAAGAQSGQIVGVVADTTGAVLPGVTVTLYGGFGEPRVSLTDGGGRFVFTGLPPGEYRLAVTSVRQTPERIGRTAEGFTSRRYFANVLTPRRAGARLRYNFR